MERQLEQRRLWAALSTLYVDTEVDYKEIAEAVRDYSLEEVEFALFERVAPVCLINMLTPAPAIWWYFDEEQLVVDIEALIRRRARLGWVGKFGSFVLGRIRRIISIRVWDRLKAEIEISKRQKPL